MTALALKTCKHCSSRMIAIQYKALRVTHITTHTSKQEHVPGVCFVCPRCDSPDAK